MRVCPFDLTRRMLVKCLDPPLLLDVFENSFLTLSFYHLHVKVYSVRANSIKSKFNFLTQIWYFGTDQTPTFQHFLVLQKESRKLFLFYYRIFASRTFCKIEILHLSKKLNNFILAFVRDRKLFEMIHSFCFFI